jgi:hypothetical protein
MKLVAQLRYIDPEGVDEKVYETDEPFVLHSLWGDARTRASLIRKNIDLADKNRLEVLDVLEAELNRINEICGSLIPKREE